MKNGDSKVEMGESTYLFNNLSKNYHDNDKVVSSQEDLEREI